MSFELNNIRNQSWLFLFFFVFIILEFIWTFFGEIPSKFRVWMKFDKIKNII
jgi:hypothetical protein